MHASSQPELPSVPKWTVLHLRFARPVQAREPQSVVSRHAPLRFPKSGKVYYTDETSSLFEDLFWTKFAGFSQHEFVDCRHTRQPPSLKECSPNNRLRTYVEENLR